ncbi:PD-(D/E)XK nuclease family protein [Gilvimarinus polysaccharolyticus]|uniref:PD-(D/E)XK nuclease family protein n=1 Tax=Gilvimarinus polysaccharolyticus TaxID=863921 RepID=UPI0006731569|nr:PD-(D/E)XK nuclease family protein [Gilvimarinus polysaccharolyticus]
MEREGLLVHLRSYRPREGRDSLENFVTEVFRWLLANDDIFSEYFIEYLQERIPEGHRLTSPSGNIRWSSQFSLNGVRPDMVAQWPGNILIFEHKVDASLAHEQLKNYIKGAEKEYPDICRAIVLIVRHRAQFSGEADIELCWSDVYQIVDQYLDKKKPPVNTVDYLKDFLALLDHEGLGLPTPVSAFALQYYNETQSLPKHLQSMYSVLKQYEWTGNLNGHTLSDNGSRDGRIGVLWDRSSKKYKWSPAIGLYCIVDGGMDHSIDHRLQGEEVKLSIIFSFTRPLQAELDKPLLAEAYKLFSLYLGSLADKEHHAGWLFYDHMEDSEAKPKNLFHRLYLEAPLWPIICNKKEIQDQAAAVSLAVKPVLEEIVDSSEFAAFTSSIDKALETVTEPE